MRKEKKHLNRRGSFLMKKYLFFIFLLPLFLFGEDARLTHIITPRGEGDPLKENKRIVQNFYDAFAKNDKRKLGEFLNSKYQVQDSNVIFDSSYSKYDAFSKNIALRLKSLHEALPNFELKILEILAEGNKVFVRFQIIGTQKGSFLGIEPTNKQIVIKNFSVFTIEDEKISYINEMWNELSVMKQIGFIIY